MENVAYADATNRNNRGQRAKSVGRITLNEMKREPLDIYDDMPRAMRRYLQHNGWHFNKKSCELAVSMLKRHNEATGKKEDAEPMTKEQVNELLKTNKVVLENNTGYDYVYVANLCNAKYLKSSVPDEAHVALFVKNVIDDEEEVDGVVFRKWYACMVAKGTPVEWEEIL